MRTVRRMIRLGAWGLVAGLAVPGAEGADTPADPSALGGRERVPGPPVVWARVAEQASHPSDYTRILAQGPPELWDAAAESLLGEKERVSGLALPVVLDRLEKLGPEMRFRVSAALVRDSRDPRILPLLTRLAFEPGPEDDPRLLTLVAERLEDPELRAAVERLRRGEEPFPRPAPTPAPASEAGSEPSPEPDAGPPLWLLAALILVSGWLGLVLFVWGMRLLTLRRLVRGLQPSTARSLAVGQVALQGEAQAFDGESLKHPVTGEVCLFHEEANEGGHAQRFCVVDATGAVTVDPRDAVLLSADGVIVPGERVHLIGEARRGPAEPGERAGVVVVAAPEYPRSAFHKAAQVMVGSVMGGLFGRGSARMLFTDPLRCFWVWDDLQATPFSRPRDTAWLVGAFLLAGTWVVVFVAAAAALLGR